MTGCAQCSVLVVVVNRVMVVGVSFTRVPYSPIVYFLSWVLLIMSVFLLLLTSFKPNMSAARMLAPEYEGGCSGGHNPCTRTAADEEALRESTHVLLSSAVAPEEEEREVVVVAPGSAVPDCSHACGSCAPCKRVTVSYTCGRHRPFFPQSQPCPLAYRCMCDGHLYPVP